MGRLQMISKEYEVTVAGDGVARSGTAQEMQSVCTLRIQSYSNRYALAIDFDGFNLYGDLHGIAR